MKDTLFNITLDNLSGSMMLTIEPKEDIVINDFCCEMIKKTNVYGILKLNVTTIDGKVKFNYDLSKKKSIAEFAKAGFNESYGRRILYNLCNAFLKLNEYYLKPNFCLLNPDYTYIGDGLNVYLPYIPVKDSKNDSDELKQYFSELLSKYFAVEGIAAYDEMFKYVYQCQALDLNHFISKFLSSEEQSRNNFVAEKQDRAANKMPMPNINQQLSQSQQQNNYNQMSDDQRIEDNKFNENQLSSAKMPNGFKMPGGGEMKMPGLNSEAPKSEKEKKGIFGLVSKKQLSQPDSDNNFIQMPNPNDQNQKNSFQQQSPKQPIFKSNNMPQRFPNGFQGSLDKTIMIDGIDRQVQNNNSGNSMAYLQYRGQNIPINDNEFVIGKANNQYKVNYAINDNPHVSRKHATIFIQGNSFYIRDEGSTNGTYVNGRSLPKMVPQPLQNGDEISIYDEVFTFCM